MSEPKASVVVACVCPHCDFPHVMPDLIEGGPIGWLQLRCNHCDRTFPYPADKLYRKDGSLRVRWRLEDE